MEYFFNDYKAHTFADKNFIRKLLVSLDCQIYFEGQSIINVGEAFSSLIFNYNNNVKVICPRNLFVLTELPCKSWFGDFNIFFNISSSYTYIASKQKRSNQDNEETNLRCLVCPAEVF